jgi:hypothetical protein
MKNTADVTGGKPIAVLLQSISGVSAINPFVVFYDIHGAKRQVLFFYFVTDTIRDTRTRDGHLMGDLKFISRVPAGFRRYVKRSVLFPFAPIRTGSA